MIRALLGRLGSLWCVLFHVRITRPVCGHYTCLECLRVYRVTWDDPQPAMPRHKRHHWETNAIADNGAVLVRKEVA